MLGSRIYWSLLILSLLWPGRPLYAQKKKSKEKKIKYDVAYIEDLSDPYTPYTYINNKFNKLKVTNSEHDLTLAYSPNTNINWGFGFNYKWIGLGFSFGLPFANRDDEKYGETSKAGFRLNFTTREFLIDTYFQRYQGFYLQNPFDFNPSWTSGDMYPQRPDMGTINIGWNFLYVTNNRKYSAKAAYSHTQIQKRNAGSALIGPFYSLFFFTADDPLLPRKIFTDYHLQFLTKGIISNFGLAIGYTYSFVVERDLLISLSLVPGLGLQTNKLFDENNQRMVDEISFAGKLLSRLAFVYHYRNFYTGFTFKSNAITYTHTENNITDQLRYNVGEARLSLGLRIYGNKKGKSWLRH